MSEVVGLITAHGGSKLIPRKNVVDLAGRFDNLDDSDCNA